jgi:hypothetical protein
LPLNIHSKEDLVTYAKDVTFVSQGTFELSGMTDASHGLIHATQCVRISASGTEFIVKGNKYAELDDDGKPERTLDTKPMIFAGVSNGGGILFDGNNGDDTNISLVAIGDGSMQAIGGSKTIPTSLVLKENLFEAAVGGTITDALNSAITISTNELTMRCSLSSNIRVSPDSIELKCGLSSIELKATGEITLKAGPTTELNLNTLGASIKSFENEIKTNAMKIETIAITLEKIAKLLAKDSFTLFSHNTKAIADALAALKKEN